MSCADWSASGGSPEESTADCVGNGNGECMMREVEGAGRKYTDCAASEDETLQNCAGQLTSGEETVASLCGGVQRNDCGGCDFCQ
jgi:hypothetical protein